jgi:hypothetical protein
MIRVTVTCLVSATGESCDCSVVRDKGGGPWAERRWRTPEARREPPARGGTERSVPPLRQFLLSNCRYLRDTRPGSSTAVVRLREQPTLRMTVHFLVLELVMVPARDNALVAETLRRRRAGGCGRFRRGTGVRRPLTMCPLGSRRSTVTAGKGEVRSTPAVFAALTSGSLKSDRMRVVFWNQAKSACV